MTSSFIETLEFDLPKALLFSLVEKFDSMPSAPLIDANIAETPEAQGVYQLFYDGNLEYIGKTDSQAGLFARLKRHGKNILGRANLDASLVTFKAIRVYVFSAMDLETELIHHYKNEGSHPMSWQNSGFGSNDPGRNRDGSSVKMQHFDYRFPVDRFTRINFSTVASDVCVSDLFKHLKSTLPFLFRYESRDDVAKEELESCFLPTGLTLTTLDQALDVSKQALGDEWQITVLYGYVIAYRESRQYSHYQHVY
ncbi:GIY-YIG nuclease family protein [Shewanella sp. A3A]|nr:GIY-YIG nuclease family protein [Shewanella ferrihydritica]